MSMGNIINMKKSFCLLLMAVAAFAASAAPKVTVTPLGKDYRPTTQKAATTTADIIVNEDFNQFAAGAPDSPDFQNELTYEDEGWKIPTELTHGQQWTGYKVYSAGGAIALQTKNPQDAAHLETPLSDYSGSVKISLKARYLITEFEQDGQKMQFTGSDLQVGIGNKRGSTFNTSDGEIVNTYPFLANLRLYENQGWCEINIEFDNYSAYNDAYIVFYCGEGILLDDVKVTSSLDKFIASPIIKGITNVTDTSFTVQFEPVKKSFNYYTYLLEIKGHDEQGQPIYDITYPPKIMEEINDSLEKWGMTWDEYKELYEISIDNPYSNLGIVENDEPTEYTFDGLDPSKDYYFAIRSHHVRTFSDMNIIHANVLGVPEVKEATDIAEGSFTANWTPITKADRHLVNLYGVNEVKEDDPDFVLFNDDFDKVSAYTDSKDIYNPVWKGADEGITLDDLASSPGWTSSEKSYALVEGKLGVKYTGAWLKSPDIYVAGADKVRISLKIETDSNEPVYLQFADVAYELPISNGVFEDELELPTNGKAETGITLTCLGDYTMFIDRLSVAQSLKKGDRTYTWLSETTAENKDSHRFTNLDAKRFDLYGYSVTAARGEGADEIKSEPSARMLVDMANNSSATRIEGTMSPEAKEVGRYTLDGVRIQAPKKGINIIRYSDGTVRKVVVK